MAVATIFHLTIIALLITAAASQPPKITYTNHTVGGNAGWLFYSANNTPAANYSAWAATQTFNLGDFLIFNTNSNQTVIQTYNETTFMNCSISDSLDNDTFVYHGGNTAFGEALTIPVALTTEGTNYFFSDADDGLQCNHGMAFEIHVNHGLGLPPNLNQPPPPPYTEPPGPDSAQSPPINVRGGSPQVGNGGLKDGVRVHAILGALLLAMTGVALF